jgi:hypothetical protein
MSFPTTTKYCTTLTDGVLSWWTRYDRRNPGTSPHDIRTAKHFIEGVMRGCSADKKEPFMTPCFRSGQTLALVGSGGLATIRFLLTCRNLFILFVPRASICPSSPTARSDGLTNTYKPSYGRSSTFQLHGELGTS